MNRLVVLAGVIVSISLALVSRSASAQTLTTSTLRVDFGKPAPVERPVQIARPTHHGAVATSIPARHTIQHRPSFENFFLPADSKPAAKDDCRQQHAPAHTSTRMHDPHASPAHSTRTVHAPCGERR